MLSLISCVLTASLIAVTALAMSCGNSSTSFPANSAFTSASPGGVLSVTPFIFMASVKQMPRNPKVPFRRLSTMIGEREAGTPVLSKAGTFRCEFMMAGTSASIKARYGYSSMESSLLRECEMVGNALCESVSVSPCPGKCLATGNTPPAMEPFMKRMAFCDTSSGSSPNERMPITGLAGLLLMSTTGAKLTWTPSSWQWRAMVSPNAKVRLSFRIAPIIPIFGNSMALLRRQPAPCSASKPINNGYLAAF